MLTKSTVPSAPKHGKLVAKASKLAFEELEKSMEGVIHTPQQDTTNEAALNAEMQALKDIITSHEITIARLTVELEQYQELKERVARMEERQAMQESAAIQREKNFPPLAPKPFSQVIGQSPKVPENEIPQNRGEKQGKSIPSRKRTKVSCDAELKLIIEGKPLKNTKLGFVYVKVQQQKISNIKAALEYMGVERKPVRHITFVGKEWTELCVFDECRDSIKAQLEAKGCTTLPLSTNPSNVHIALGDKNDGRVITIKECARLAKARLSGEIKALGERRATLKVQLELAEDNGILTGVINAYSASARLTESQSQGDDDGRRAH